MRRPIVFFDLETTGKSQNPDDVRILEISAVKVNPETLEEIDKLYYKCNNDGVPIDPDATERHGLVEADLIGFPPFKEVAKQTFDFFNGCDVGGYYCSVFDIPILYYSFIRAGFTFTAEFSTILTSSGLCDLPVDSRSKNTIGLLILINFLYHKYNKLFNHFISPSHNSNSFCK